MRSSSITTSLLVKHAPPLMSTQDNILDRQGDIILILHALPTEETADEEASDEEMVDDEPATFFTAPEEPPKQFDSRENGEAASGPASLAMDAGSQPVRYLVSSRHLCLASPVFCAMLKGPWREKPGTGEVPVEIGTSQWDPEARQFFRSSTAGTGRSSELLQLNSCSRSLSLWTIISATK